MIQLNRQPRTIKMRYVTVEITAAGPRLLIGRFTVASWLGVEYDATAEDLAKKVDDEINRMMGGIMSEEDDKVDDTALARTSGAGGVAKTFGGGVGSHPRVLLGGGGGAVDMGVSQTQAVIAERRTTHGSFEENTMFMQALKDLMRAQPNWGKMRSYQREALDMFAHKMGRVLHGDPDYDDHWRDISGYAERVCQILKGGET